MLMVDFFIEFFDSVLENILILDSFFLRMNILGFIMFHLLFILHRNSQLYMLILIVQFKFLISQTGFVKLVAQIFKLTAQILNTVKKLQFVLFQGVAVGSAKSNLSLKFSGSLHNRFMETFSSSLRFLKLNRGHVQILFGGIEVLQSHIHAQNDHLQILDLVLLCIDMSSGFIVHDQRCKFWALGRPPWRT